jgi:hypothetical protein
MLGSEKRSTSLQFRWFSSAVSAREIIHLNMRLLTVHYVVFPKTAAITAIRAVIIHKTAIVKVASSVAALAKISSIAKSIPAINSSQRCEPRRHVPVGITGGLRLIVRFQSLPDRVIDRVNLTDPQYAEDHNQERNDNADTAPSEDAAPPNPRCFGQTRCRNCHRCPLSLPPTTFAIPISFFFHNTGSSHARALSGRAPLGCGSARAW